MANIKKAAKVNSLLPLIKLNYDLPLILQGIFFIVMLRLLYGLPYFPINCLLLLPS